MQSFEYTAPTTKEQAVHLLGNDWSQAEPLAGGTDLLSLMKDNVVAPKRLVNIKHVGGLDAVAAAGAGGLRAGALIKLHDFAENAEVRRRFPVLAEAVDDAASPQIRHMATLGGNLCQRPRCWYFRSGFGLLARDPSGKALVPEGDNRYHAILGNDGPAYFVSPSTIVPALIAHNATVTVFGPNGARNVALEKFYRIPKSPDEREYDLAPNEIITDVTIPALPAGARAAQYEVRQKYSFDWPLAMASVVLQMDGNTVHAARVVLGHVAPVPWLSPEAEQALVGKPISEQTADAAGQAAVAKAKPLSRNAYKVQLARVAVKRAILQAAKGGRA